MKGALNEAARVYVELVKAGAGLKYLDVGGGLGVDYDGSQTNFESSVNYTLEEYAVSPEMTLQQLVDEHVLSGHGRCFPVLAGSELLLGHLQRVRGQPVHAQ